MTPLHRRQHTPLYVLVETAYRTLSQSFSEGRTADVLGLVSDMGVTRGRRSKQRDDSLCVYPDWGRRTGYTAAIVARLAAELGIARVRGLFAPGHRQRRLQGGERDHMLGVVTSHLGRMKGPLMKMAQHVGYLGLDLPHDIDYQLRQLFDQSPCASADAIRAIVEAELRAPLCDVFREFSEEPVGTGSIGQVHRAVLMSGERVAVKVQYPGIEEALGHDFWNLSVIGPLAHLLRPNEDWAGLFGEVRKQVTLECDYRREAHFQSLFRDMYREHAYIRIPAVHHDFVTKRVLTTEYVEGVSFLEYTESASQKQKHRIVDALYEFTSTPASGTALQVDGNPGNFLFTDTHMYFIDFGSVVELRPEAMRTWIEYMWSMAAQDVQTFRRTARSQGTLVDPTHFAYQAALSQADVNRCADAVDAVLSEKRLSFSRHSAQNFLGILSIKGMVIPPDLVFLQRGQAGLFCLLGHLGSALNDRVAAGYFAAALAPAREQAGDLDPTDHRTGQQPHADQAGSG